MRPRDWQGWVGTFQFSTCDTCVMRLSGDVQELKVLAPEQYYRFMVQIRTSNYIYHIIPIVCRPQFTNCSQPSSLSSSPQRITRRAGTSVLESLIHINVVVARCALVVLLLVHYEVNMILDLPFLSSSRYEARNDCR